MFSLNRSRSRLATAARAPEPASLSLTSSIISVVDSVASVFLLL